jgi:hypothetical protein
MKKIKKNLRGAEILPISPPTMLNTLSIDDAKARITEFKTKIQNANWNPNIMKTQACHIAHADMSNLKDLNVDGIRCYFGVRTDPKQKKEVLTLIVVGTRTLLNGTHEDVLFDRNGNSAIFDFTTPCPDTCDPNSPLHFDL